MKCNSVLRRIKNKNNKNYFWGCSNYPNCNAIYSDKNNAPNFEEPKTTPCPKCNTGKMYHNKSKYGYYWKCGKCKVIMADNNGTPTEKKK